jgi:hypothetical protein
MAQTPQQSLLEENTELFDLFGEEGFCTICQMNLTEGERIRAIQKCQHLYHAECLEPWLRAHTTCPVCRTDVFPPSNEEDTEYNTTILNLWSIIQAQVLRIQRDYHRRLLTWVIYDGIVHQLPNAGAFNEQIATVQNYLHEHPVIVNDVEIYHIERVRNRTQVVQYLRNIGREISNLDSLESVRQIRAHRDVQQMRNRVQTYALNREDFRRIWV